MPETDRERWNEKYRQRDALSRIDPDEWLVEALSLIERNGSAPGRALDVACGLGHNAMWLSQQEWSVDGVDVSDEGLRLAQATAESNCCDVNWIAADLDQWQPEPNSYDLVVVFRFLDRGSVPRVVNSGLKPGGWLVYETFSEAQLQRPDSHIRNPAFTLSHGELQRLFRGYHVEVDRNDVLDDRTVCRFLARRL